MSGYVLPPGDMPDPDVLDVREKLEHARAHLRDAESLRENLAGALVADEIAVPQWFATYLETELHTADHRLHLWRDVVAELERRLAALVDQAAAELRARLEG